MKVLLDSFLLNGHTLGSVYVYLTSLDDNCSLVAAGAHIATRSNGYRSSRHHQGVSPLTNPPPSEVFSPRQWIKERGIISVCDSIWLGANSIKLSRCGGELAMGRNRQLPSLLSTVFKLVNKNSGSATWAIKLSSPDPVGRANIFSFRCILRSYRKSSTRGRQVSSEVRDL